MAAYSALQNNSLFRCICYLVFILSNWYKSPSALSSYYNNEELFTNVGFTLLLRNFKVTVLNCSCSFTQALKVRRHFTGESPEFPWISMSLRIRGRIRWNNVATNNTNSNAHTQKAATLTVENIQYTHTTHYCIPYLYDFMVREEGGTVHFTLFHPKVERTHLFIRLLSVLALTHTHKYTHMGSYT